MECPGEWEKGLFLDVSLHCHARSCLHVWVWTQVQGSWEQAAVASSGLGGQEGALRIRPSLAVDVAVMIPITVFGTRHTWVPSWLCHLLAA